MVNFRQGYLKNHSEYYNNIFSDSYQHKGDYFRKVSLLRGCSSKLLTAIFLLLFLQQLLLFFYSQFSFYVFDIFYCYYISRLIFVDCMFIFSQYTLNEQLILRRKIRARKKSCKFFEIKLFIGKGTQGVNCHSDRGHVTN